MSTKDTHIEEIDPPQEDLTIDEARRRLGELALQIEAFRTASEIPAIRMPDRFKQLKSYRIVERVIAGDFADMKQLETLEKHLTTFESVVAIINTPTPRAIVRPFSDFPIALQLRRAFVRTMKKTGPNRFILLIAPPGRGKTQSLLALQEIYKAPRVIIVEASKAWRDKPLPFLREIWKGMGKTDALDTGANALDRVVSELKSSRTCVAIDEGHYLEANQLNVITNLINSTPGEFILAGQPTLWGRLERDRGVFLETRQLTRNRLSCRLNFGDLNTTDMDTTMLIDRRANWLNGRSKEAVEMLMKHAPVNGNLGFVRNVIERIEDAVEDGAPKNWGTFKEALDAELTER